MLKNEINEKDDKMDNKSKALIESIVAVIVCFLLFRLTGVCLAALNIKGFVGNFIAELCFAIYSIIALVVLNRIDVIKFKLEGLKDGLIAGGVIILIFISVLLALAVGTISVTASATNIVFYVLQMILIGVAEEVSFRGILQNSVMDYIGYDTVGKIRIGIIISGVIFALIHLTNAASPEISFGAACQQAISVVPLGVLFGVIYYISKKNIWAVIILHAINDFYTFIVSGILSDVSQNEVLNTKSNSVIGTYLLFGLIAVWLMRRKKLSE